MLLDDPIRQARLKKTNTKYASKAARDAFYQRQAWRNKRKEILMRENNECQVSPEKLQNKIDREGGLCG